MEATVCMHTTAAKYRIAGWWIRSSRSTIVGSIVMPLNASCFQPRHVCLSVGTSLTFFDGKLQAVSGRCFAARVRRAPMASPVIFCASGLGAAPQEQCSLHKVGTRVRPDAVPTPEIRASHLKVRGTVRLSFVTELPGFRHLRIILKVSSHSRKLGRPPGGTPSLSACSFQGDMDVIGTLRHDDIWSHPCA